MALAKYTGVFNLLFRNLITINNYAVTVTDSGDAAKGQVSSAIIECKIALNDTFMHKSGSVIGEVSRFSKSTHKCFFFKNITIKIGDKATDEKGKEYIVDVIDEMPAGLDKFKVAYMSSVEK